MSSCWPFLKIGILLLFYILMELHRLLVMCVKGSAMKVEIFYYFGMYIIIARVSYF